MSIFDEQGYINNTTVDKNILNQCFEAQQQLNPLFDKHYLNEYLQARSELFPESARGSKDNKNRAGDKLIEMLKMARIQVQNIQIMGDICCIPGAWTCYVIEHNKQAKSILLSKKIQDKKDYYQDIKQSKNCYIVQGVDGGDIYQKDSLIQYLQKVQEVSNIKVENSLVYTPGLDIFLADGGFQIDLHDGKHVEHLQEIITQRLFLSQVLYGLYSIKSNAPMIIKCFDVCTNFSIQLLHLVGSLFDCISIIKTEHSRVTNSEKYIIFHNLQANIEQINQVIDILQTFYVNYKDDMCFKHIYNEEIEKLDTYQRFSKKINEISQILMIKQAVNLKNVVKRTNEIVKQNKYQ